MDLRGARATYGAWWMALACFVLAGATGALFRLALVYGLVPDLSPVNLRHAHSHLMYFGWATPALMALLAASMPAVAGRPGMPGVRRVLAVVFVTALLAYPLFLLYGYTPAVLGARRLPLSVMAAGLNVLGWYAFVVCYVRATRGVRRGRALRLWDLALGFMVLATCGAWGLALMKPLGVEDPVWAAALTHFFLDLFSEGWFVLAVLGLAYAAAREEGTRLGDAGRWLIAAGLPLTFVFGMPPDRVPAGLVTPARLGAVLVAVGLLVNVGVLGRRLRGWSWRVPLGLLGLKAAGQLTLAFGPVGWWAASHGLRILYLHTMLLGFVTLGLVAAARHVWGEDAVPAHRGLYAAVLALLATLLPLSRLWPGAWAGTWAAHGAAWGALLPVAAATAMLWAVRRRRHPAARPVPES
ncbi:MAG: hypothetical protein KatS3mg042_0404 [Rhodothermaceae bacterium]|nr:MAG: hypothetical protein KatS3mg042_0404 [Rhodothermaceae bacterium]